MSNHLWPHGLQPASLVCPWDFPSKNTGMGYHVLLQEFSWPRDQIHLSGVSCIADGFFTPEPLGKLHTKQSVQFSCSVMSDSLWSHGLQHARPPYPSPSPGIYSNSCPLSQWCYLIISFSTTAFSFCRQFFPASGSFPMRQFFTSGGQILELQHQFFQWIFRVDFL